MVILLKRKDEDADNSSEAAATEAGSCDSDTSAIKMKHREL